MMMITGSFNTKTDILGLEKKQQEIIFFQGYNHIYVLYFCGLPNVIIRK